MGTFVSWIVAHLDFYTMGAVHAQKKEALMAYVVMVSFEIVGGQMQAFLPLMQENARASVRDEPGCLQFDVCTDAARPDSVFLYEVYTDRAAFDAHLHSPHFLSFDAAVSALIGQKSVMTFDTVAQNGM